MVHYGSRASIIVFVCTGARLLLFSRVLLPVERNYCVSCFWSL